MPKIQIEENLEIGFDEDEYYEFDPTDAEHLCVGCGTREAILNQCCAMCTELHPELMGYAG